MSVNFFSLPVEIQNKISALEMKKIHRIVEFHYPSGQTEINVYGVDLAGWACYHIFSI